MLISAGERTISAKVASKKWKKLSGEKSKDTQVGNRDLWKISRRPSSTSSYQGNMYILIATESARNPVKKGAKVWSGFAVTFSFRNVFSLHLSDHQSVRIDLAQASLRSREVWNVTALPSGRRRWRRSSYQSPSRIDRRQPHSLAYQVVLACAGPREMSSLWLKEKNEKLLKPRGTYPLYLGVFPNDSAQRCSNTFFIIINDTRILMRKDDVWSWRIRSTSWQTFMRRKWCTMPLPTESTPAPSPWTPLPLPTRRMPKVLLIIQRLSPMTATRHGLQMSYLNDREVDHRCLLYFESNHIVPYVWQVTARWSTGNLKAVRGYSLKSSITWSKGTLTWDWSFTDLTSVQNRSTVNYRYNVTDGTLKKLRYIRFYVIPV